MFSQIDESLSPPSVSFPRAYNAAVDLLDRHLEQGRTDKRALIDDAGPVTYGQLAERANRAGNLLASLGVREEERVLLALLDTRDFPALFLGAIKLGAVPVPVNTLMQPQDYAHFALDSRARVLVVSDALLPKMAQAISESPYLKEVIVAKTHLGGVAHPHKALDELLEKSSPKLDAARGVLALLERLDWPAKGRGALAFAPRPDRGVVRPAGPGDSRRRRGLLGREALLRLRPRQRADLSASRRRDRDLDGRAPDSGGGVPADQRRAADHLLRRADPLCLAARGCRDRG